MPSQSSIVAALGRIANDGFVVAVVWHLVMAVALVAILAGWRPSKRATGSLLAAPVASVAIVAAVHSNPFNAAVFAALSLVLVSTARGLAAEPAVMGPRWAAVAGAAMVAFGWAYPHFLEGRAPVAYLYGAPMGLVPCPTLSLVIGVSLLVGGLSSRAWMLVLALVGGFYGLYGALGLGVIMDLALASGAAALALLATGVSLPRRGSRSTTA